MVVNADEFGEVTGNHNETQFSLLYGQKDLKVSFK